MRRVRPARTWCCRRAAARPCSGWRSRDGSAGRWSILGPNTAIQGQWLREWQRFAPPAVQAGADPDLSSPITALTYQAVCNLDPASAELDELGGWAPTASPGEATKREVAAERSRRRRLVARGGESEHVLALLHPNGRALLERIRALGPSTLILDECHHLLEMWGALLAAVLDVLGPQTFVVGLTATPPDDMERAKASCTAGSSTAPPDFQVPTPALVKEGDLAPYQELALLTEPLPHEAEYIETQERRFQELITALLDPGFASLPFIAWLEQRIVRPATDTGAPIAWSELRRTEPDLALAALRLLSTRGLRIPEDAVLGEAERRPPSADDWAVLLGRLLHRVARAERHGTGPRGLGAGPCGAAAARLRADARGRAAACLAGGPGAGAVGEQVRRHARDPGRRVCAARSGAAGAPAVRLRDDRRDRRRATCRACSTRTPGARRCCSRSSWRIPRLVPCSPCW